MKPSQQKLFDWYKNNTNRFNNIESINELENGEVEIVTDCYYFLIGKKGGLTLEKKIK